MKPTRIAPDSPAMTPPTMKTVNLSWTGFLPMATAAISRSRTARRLRPYGELTTRFTSTNTSTTQTAVRPTEKYWQDEVLGSIWSDSGGGTRARPAAPLGSGPAVVITPVGMIDSTSTA